MVRDCDLSDLEHLMDLAIGFNDKHYDVKLNRGKTYQYLRNLIQSEDAVVLCTGTGAIVGVKIDDPCRDWTVLVETAWYSEGRDGLRLLRAFEQRGRDMEVDEVRMTTLAVNSGVSPVLERLGYLEIETSHRLLI